MWKWLEQQSEPRKAYALCDHLMPWFTYSAWISLVVGIIWGLAFAPADYQQSDSYRIIFVHVPAAIFGMGIYVAMAIAAIIAAIWQWKTAHLTMMAMAPVGAVFTLISLFTGAAWGKPMWGTWWIWDARLTSQLILLFLYLGVIALYAVFEDKKQAGKAAGLLSMIGVINVPIIHFSVEWWNTLHQGATITKFGEPSMPPDMLYPLLVCLFGFAAFASVVTLMRLKTLILEQHKTRNWVTELVLFKGASK